MCEDVTRDRKNPHLEGIRNRVGLVGSDTQNALADISRDGTDLCHTPDRRVPVSCGVRVANRRGPPVTESTPLERKVWHQHINYREALAVYTAIKNHYQELRDRYLTVWSDNGTTLALLSKVGSMRCSKLLLDLTRVILELCATNNIRLMPRYIQGARNMNADHLTRPCLGWSTPQRVGVLELDSFGLLGHAYGADPFSLDWRGHRILPFPPLYLIQRATEVLMEWASKGKGKSHFT